ncbi:hypothetical protein GCM10009784_08150 [Arthrobacter parietis]|uniref:DUF4760 domain-containing protein n=1 Tax=Arthrobacter parietis TaxID=271434 RepID=A0ABN3AQR4_9MICC
MGFWETVGTAVITAFITGVVFQYVFAPWLEAHKAVKLEQAMLAHQLAGKLRQTALILFGLKNYMGRTEDNYVSDRAQQRMKMFELGLVQDYVELAVPQRYALAVGRVIGDVDNLLSFYRPEDGYLDEALQGVRRAATMISPTTPPFLRWWHWARWRWLYWLTRKRRLAARERVQLEGQS